MLVGELSKGKTSLVNSILQFYAGVQFQDYFRYQLPIFSFSLVKLLIAYLATTEYHPTEDVRSYKIPAFGAHQSA